MNIISVNPVPQYPLSPYLYMQFAEPLGNTDSSIDAAWDFLAEKWQPKAIEIVKRLAPPMLRWGGCFASYYHWKEAVGPMSERKPMFNLCWDGIYLNHVGTAELVDFARQVGGAELLFCVNFESDGWKGWSDPCPGVNRLGTAEEAAEWVRYCNDPDDALRISHGYKAPFGIKYWQIGNETSYEKSGFTPEQNAEKACRFIRAMREADKGLKLIVWGDGPNDAWQPNYLKGIPCDWAQKVCEAVGDTAEMVAFHNHFGGGPKYAALHGTEYRRDPDLTWEKSLEATRDFEDRIIYMEDSIAPYGRKLAITEGHFVLRGRHRGDLLSSWYAGIAYARCANILERHGRVVEIATLSDFMGNRWQNNSIMLPTPIWTKEPAYFLPCGTIMGLFSQHLGRQAVGVHAPDGLDISASRTDGKIFLHIVNLSRTQAKPLRLSIPGFNAIPSRILEISPGLDEEVSSMNPEVFAPHDVTPAEEYTLPAAAVCVIEVEAQKNI